MTVKDIRRWCMVMLLAAASLAAGGNDLRLVEAVKKQDKEGVHRLLAQKVDVNAPQADGATALHWAAHWDDLDTADLLIRAGANVNAADDLGVTPLALACTNARAAVVERLLSAGANANITLPTGETALMTAARTGNVEVVKALLTRGANVKASEAVHGQTALMWALSERHPEVARVLIESGADVHARSKRGFMPIMFAAQQGDLEAVRTLIAAGANVNDATPDGSTPLLVATQSGHEGLAAFLVEQGADSNVADSLGGTALHYAVQIQAESRYLGAYPVQLDTRHKTAKFELVTALLKDGANPNARLTKDLPRPPGDLGGFSGTSQAGATPFFLAAANGDVTLMRVLAASGANPLLPTLDKATPLMAAVGFTRLEGGSRVPESSALEAAQLTVELGADVNAVDKTGMSALHGAAYYQETKVIQFLVAKGATPDVRDSRGRTPLSIAEGEPVRGGSNQYPNKETVDLLRKLGAQVGLTETRGGTKLTPK
jgi:ankyrin repeat protein